MSQEPQDPIAEETAEDILAAFQPEDKPVEITLPNGSVMTFKPVPTTTAKKALEKRILAFMATIPERGTAAYRAFPNSDVMPDDQEQVFISLFLHFRALKPAISQRTAFLYHKAPDLIEHLESRIGVADKNLFQLKRAAAIEEAQKKSRTPGSEDDSNPAESPSQGETPTA